MGTPLGPKHRLYAHAYMDPLKGRCLYQASAAGGAELVRKLLEAGADENYLHYEEAELPSFRMAPSL